MSIIAIVPAEVALDARLTKMQLRVLIALLTFRAKNTDTVWPKRETLAKRCGYHVNNISKVTKELVALGWLEKEGKGGYSKSTQYRITVPIQLTTLTEPVTVKDPTTITEVVTVTEPVTVTEVVSTTLTEPVRSTLTEPVRRKEQPNEHTNEHKQKAIALGVCGDLWDEFLKTRKRVKASNTPLALTTLVNKLEKFSEEGYSPQELVETANESGWKTVYPSKNNFSKGTQQGPRSMRGVQ